MASRLVFLRGVTPQSRAEYDLLPSYLDPAMLRKKSTKVPEEFTGCDSWVTNPVNLHCWCCGDLVNSFVWFVPTDITLAKGTIQRMKTHGCFCGMPCAVRHNNHELQDPSQKETRGRMLMRLFELNQKLPLNSVTILFEAPDPLTNLAEYGRGGMSREDYRRLLLQQKLMAVRAATAPAAKIAAEGIAQ